MIGDRIEVNIAGGLDVELPRMVRVRQQFKTPALEDVPGAVAAQFDNPVIRGRIKPGMRGLRLPGHRQCGRVRGHCGSPAESPGR